MLPPGGRASGVAIIIEDPHAVVLVRRNYIDCIHTVRPCGVSLFYLVLRPDGQQQCAQFAFCCSTDESGRTSVRPLCVSDPTGPDPCELRIWFQFRSPDRICNVNFSHQNLLSCRTARLTRPSPIVTNRNGLRDLYGLTHYQGVWFEP